MVAENKNCKLVLVGDGSQKESLKIFAKSNNLDDSIVFTGWSTDVDKFYSVADAYVMTSIWESFGLVFLDAMRHKLPIVATNTQGIPEVVKDGVTGLLSPVNDPVAIFENLNKIAKDKELRKTLGEAGHERLNQEFSYDKFIREHLNLYDEITTIV